MEDKPTPIAIDFETLPIHNDSGEPPRPICFAAYHPTHLPDGKYYAFGHNEDNNCTFEQAKEALLELWAWPGGIVFHNAAFDIAVAEYHFDAPRLSPEMYHDTMLLAFLYEPNSPGVDLKGLGEKVLSMPKDEQDAVKEYLVAHKEAFNPKLSVAKGSDNYFMRFLVNAPGDLVGEYAIGDVIRTHKLYVEFIAYIKYYDMEKAYFLEIETMLLLMGMRYTGIRVDLEKLCSDINKYDEILNKVTMWLYDYFEPENINLNSNPQVVQALLAKGEIREQDLMLTKTGKLSGSAESLAKALPSNSTFSAMFGYRQKLAKFLSTFMLPWEEMASKSGGIVYTTWHQVKNASTTKVSGTRTGRLSSTPNLQNIPRTSHKPFFMTEDRKELPECPLKDTLDLPQIRSYVVPFKEDHVLICIDYSQQELRILAHYEDDRLLRAYQEDKNLDVHTYVMDMVNAQGGVAISRGATKAVNFGIIYGQRAKGLAEKLNITKDAAHDIMQAYFKAFPGVSVILKKLSRTADSGKPFKTLGGRVYFGEPPLKDGRSLAYKAPNTEFQGSAADMSKSAIVEYNKVKDEDVVILLQVHDEFLLSCPRHIALQEYDKIKLCMESYPCDCPLIAEGVHDKLTWADCK